MWTTKLIHEEKASKVVAQIHVFVDHIKKTIKNDITFIFSVHSILMSAEFDRTVPDKIADQADYIKSSYSITQCY